MAATPWRKAVTSSHESIILQASEDRSGDFDRSFNPLETHTKSLWLSIAAARLNGIAMPAVELIMVGEIYAVRDGHHRISVAKALGLVLCQIACRSVNLLRIRPVEILQRGAEGNGRVERAQALHRAVEPFESLI